MTGGDERLRSARRDERVRGRCRVLHVLGSAGVDGTGIAGMVPALALQLDRGEFEFAACFLGAPGPWTARLGVAGVAAAEVPWEGPSDIDGARRFWRYLRAQRPDLLHIHYGGRSVRWLARAATGAKVVVHLHGRVRNEQDYRPVALRLRGVDAVIATSRAVADAVVHQGARVVYPGVCTMPARAGRPLGVLGAAGRLVPIKGYDRLIRAFAAVRKTHPAARLEIAGEGPQRNVLERLAAELDLTDAVKFLGWIDDLHAVMAGWSAFVQPSLEEALGIAALQAMAAGLPVIATRVGGLPEFVEDRVSGLLVPPDDVDALVEAIGWVLDEPRAAARLAEAGRRRSSQFSEQRFAAEVAAIYREVLAASARL